jgi:signal transduction histidine kinase/ligand-binding sensor domain-containing protein
MKKNLLFFGFALLLSACTKEVDNQPPSPPVDFNPPEMVYLGNLPDSLKPNIVPISERPAPRVIAVPSQDGGSYSYMEESGEIVTTQLLAPTTKNLPFLKDENGRAILDKRKNTILLGEGGISQFKSYGTDDGLGLDAVYCAILDSRGHLWFGTNGGGVSRFDGVEFTTYTTTQGLAGNILRSIFEDSKGNLWFGTLGGGISKYDGKSFTNFNSSDGLGEDIVFSIEEDPDGNLWFGTGGGGASKFDGVTFTSYTTAEGLADNVVTDIKSDGLGNLYFATNGGGLSKFDGKSFINYSENQGLAGNRIRCITLSKNGGIWLGTIGTGVSFFDGHKFQNFSLEDGLAGNIVRAIWEEPSGKVWFATESGISRYENSAFTSYTRDQGLSANSVLDITADKSGNLWFSTEGGGVSRFDSNSFTNFTTSQGLGSNIVLSMVEDHQGNLWFGNAGGGTSKYDGKSFQTFTVSQGMGGDVVNAILKDSKNNLWFGTGGGGVSKFDGKTFTTYTTAQGLIANEVYAIWEDSNGVLWFGTDGGGLSSFDGNLFTSYTRDQGLAGNTILGISEDDFGQIWLAAVDGGLSRFDGKSFTSFTTKQGLLDNSVTKVVWDFQGNLWIGTEMGLNFLSKVELRKISDPNFQGNPNFKSFTTADGLPDNVILQIVPLPENQIALGTNLGIAIFDGPEENQDEFDSLQNIEIFNSNTGFPVKDLTDGQNGMYLDSKGVLWAGTGNNSTALVRFDYRALRKNTKLPSLLVKQVRINEELVSWQSLDSHKLDPNLLKAEELNAFGKELSQVERENLQTRFKGIQLDGISGFFPVPQNLVLPYRHNHINIDFGSDELAKPFLVEYQYILEGYDLEWSPVLKKTSATFGNIQEGEYTFKVKARFTGPANGEAGLWTDPISYSFSVLPPWYRTWWAYVFYTLIFLSAIYPIHRYQRNLAIKAEQEKAKERELAQAKEIEKAYTKLEAAHENLKATQNQLIQQEKLASLGLLTAGIAHEIKNPLNFVKNFSELSIEFLHEIDEEMEKLEETPVVENVKDLLADIKVNLSKIQHHGGRADGIVKSMLMHSRGGGGDMEPTDLNDLVREYTNLSFHGMRANKNPINVDLQLDLDESIPKVKLNTEDFSRVILNLTKNAFDAMREKINSVGSNYKAKLIVRTKDLGEKILLEVEDNGPGVPDEIRDKLLMPFFTTKKGTEGTGLGLSITHDIINAHSGVLEITTEVGEWTKFSIILPK